MSDRSESGGATIAVVVILILILLLTMIGVGGGFLFVRQQRAVVEAMRMRELVAAREAQLAARIAAQANEAQAVAETAKAESDQADATADKTNSNASQDASAAIEAVLQAQADAWNAGKIDVFMQHYWKSDELTFSSGGKITRGWTATRDRYHEKYPTPEKMGKLKFDELEIKPLGNAAALVLGRWTLERETEPLTGNFSLVLQKLDGQWLIIHDHTSRLAE